MSPPKTPEALFTGVSQSQPTGPNHGTHQLGLVGVVAATHVSSGEPWLAQSTISFNCGAKHVYQTLYIRCCTSVKRGKNTVKISNIVRDTKRHFTLQ